MFCVRRWSEEVRKQVFKGIRVHDLRHSHVSLLINMGFTAFEIGKRVGHGGEKITYRYAHLFSNKQREMADFLDKERGFTKEIFEGGQNDVTQEQR
jgi:integrase